MKIARNCDSEVQIYLLRVVESYSYFFPPFTQELDEIDDQPLPVRNRRASISAFDANSVNESLGYPTGVFQNHFDQILGRVEPIHQSSVLILCD